MNEVQEALQKRFDLKEELNKTGNIISEDFNTENSTVYNMHVDFSGANKKIKKYYLFVINNVSFKPVENLTEREAILKSLDNFEKFYRDINLLLNFRSNEIIKNFTKYFKTNNTNPIIYIEFEDLILKLAKEEETKEIILKYFDIKE